MKHIQESVVTGYVTISVIGKRPELFFQQCTSSGIRVWNVRKTESDVCEGNIKLSDIKQVKQLRSRTVYKIRFTNRKGYPFFIRRFLRKKELLLGFICSVLLILFLSNILWEVKITGVPKDIEEKISKQLEQYGIHAGTWIFSLDSPKEIQQQLLDDVPELLWVGINQKGTTFFLEGVEKVVVKEEENPGPRNLVASKKGIIKKMYVSSGVPKVQVNDYVHPGDILVSGKMSDKSTEEDDAKKEEKKVDYVAADGEITATTWYEVKVTVPLNASSEQLTGNKEKKFYLGFGNFQLPIWGFKTPEYTYDQREITENPIRFLKWELPVKMIETLISEKTYKKDERTKNQAIKTGIKQAKEELRLQLGPEAQILSEKVLHESVERGKVKLNLYMSVEENIVETQPLRQGD
nr:sporulation protein YqfD [Priestia megaterium]